LFDGSLQRRGLAVELVLRVTTKKILRNLLTTKSIQVKITEINKKLLNLGKLVKDLTDNFQNKTGIDSSTVLMSSDNSKKANTIKNVENFL
jgi:hypothetical protein